MTLNRPFTLAGARNRAHLHLVSSSVSKCHAAIIHDNGRVYIRDLCSRTHVYVNGRVIHEMELTDGDLLQIGSFTFKLQHPSAGAEVPSPAPGQLVEANNGGGVLPLDGRTTVIGRRAGCDLHIDDERVSTIHAIIFELDGLRYVRDLGSRTGTFVNGVAAHQQPLNLNDRLRVGPREFIYRPAESGTGTFEDITELEDLVGTARLGHDELLGFTSAGQPQGSRQTVAEPGVPAQDGEATSNGHPSHDAMSVAGAGLGLAGAAYGGLAEADLVPLADEDDLIPLAPEPSRSAAPTVAAVAPVALPEPIDLDADPDMNGVTSADTVGLSVPGARPAAPPTISPMVEDLSAASPVVDASTEDFPSDEVEAAAESMHSADSVEEPAIDDDFFAELRQGAGEPDEVAALAEWPEVEGEGLTAETAAPEAEPIADTEIDADIGGATSPPAETLTQADEVSHDVIRSTAIEEPLPEAPADQSAAAGESQPADMVEFPEMDDLGMSAHVIGVMPAQWARGPEATPLAVDPADASGTFPADPQVASPADVLDHEPTLEAPADAPHWTDFEESSPPKSDELSTDDVVAESAVPTYDTPMSRGVFESASPLELTPEQPVDTAVDMAAEPEAPSADGTAGATDDDFAAAIDWDIPPIEEAPVSAATVSGPDLDAASSTIDPEQLDVAEIEAGDIDPSLTEEGLPAIGPGVIAAGDIDPDAPLETELFPGDARAVASTPALPPEEADVGSDISDQPELDAAIDFAALDAAAANMPSFEFPTSFSPAIASPTTTAKDDLDTGLDFVEETPPSGTTPGAGHLDSLSTVTASAQAPANLSATAASLAPVAAPAVVGAVTVAGVAAAAVTAVPPQTAGKRSLWSRLFGRKPAPETASAAPLAVAPVSTVVVTPAPEAAPATPVRAAFDVDEAMVDSLDRELEATPVTAEDSSMDLGRGDMSWPPVPQAPAVAVSHAGTTDEPTPVEGISTLEGNTPLEEVTPVDDALLDDGLAFEPATELTADDSAAGAGNIDIDATASMPGGHSMPVEFPSSGSPDAATADNENVAAPDEQLPSAPENEAPRPLPTIGVAEITLSGVGGHGGQLVLSGFGPVDQMWGISTGAPMDFSGFHEPTTAETPAAETTQESASHGEPTDAVGFNPSIEVPTGDLSGPGDADFSSISTTPMVGFDTASAAISTDIAPAGAAALTDQLPDGFFEELIDAHTPVDEPPPVASESVTDETFVEPLAESPLDVAPSEPAALESPAAELSTTEPTHPTDDAAGRSFETPTVGMPEFDPFSLHGRDQGSFFGGMPLSLGSLQPQEPPRPARPRLPFGDRPVTMDTRADVLAEVTMVEPEAMPMFGAPLPPGARDETRFTPLRSDLVPIHDDDFGGGALLTQSHQVTPPASGEPAQPAGGTLANAAATMPPDMMASQSTETAAEPPASEIPVDVAETATHFDSELSADEGSQTPVFPPELPVAGEATLPQHDLHETPISPVGADDAFEDLLDDLQTPSVDPVDSPLPEWTPTAEHTAGDLFDGDASSPAEAVAADQTPSVSPPEAGVFEEVTVVDEFLPEQDLLLTDAHDPLSAGVPAVMEMPLEEPPPLPTDASELPSSAGEPALFAVANPEPVAEDLYETLDLDSDDFPAEAPSTEAIRDEGPAPSNESEPLISDSFASPTTISESPLSEPPIFESVELEEATASDVFATNRVTPDTQPADGFSAAAPLPAEQSFGEFDPPPADARSAEGAPEVPLDDDWHVSEAELMHDEPAVESPEPAFVAEHVESTSIGFLPPPATADGESTIAGDFAEPTPVVTIPGEKHEVEASSQEEAAASDLFWSKPTSPALSSAEPASAEAIWADKPAVQEMETAPSAVPEPHVTPTDGAASVDMLEDWNVAPVEPPESQSASFEAAIEPDSSAQPLGGDVIEAETIDDDVRTDNSLLESSPSETTSLVAPAGDFAGSSEWFDLPELVEVEEVQEPQDIAEAGSATTVATTLPVDIFDLPADSLELSGTAPVEVSVEAVATEPVTPLEQPEFVSPVADDISPAAAEEQFPTASASTTAGEPGFEESRPEEGTTQAADAVATGLAGVDALAPTAAGGVLAAGAAAAALSPGKKPGMAAKPRPLIRPAGMSKPGIAKAVPRPAKPPVGRTPTGPGTAAPLARKFDKPVGPRRVIAAKPAATPVSPGFRPPVVPAAPASKAEATPAGPSLPARRSANTPAIAADPRSTGLPSQAVRRPAALPTPAAAPRDPFTNTGDLAQPAVVAPKSSKRRLVLVLIAVVLTVAAIVAVWLLMGPRSTVQGRLQYRGLDSPRITADVRRAFHQQQIAALTERQVLEDARRQIYDKGMSLGMLDEAKKDDAVRLIESLSAARWDDRSGELVIDYRGATGEADRSRMLAILHAAKRRYDESPKASAGDEAVLGRARTRIGQIDVALSNITDRRAEAERQIAQGPTRSAEADSLRKKAIALKAEFESLPQKTRALEKEIAMLENLPSLAANAVVSSDENDTELKRLTDQLKSLNESLNAAMEASTNNAGDPKSVLDAAQQQFDTQVAAARDAAAGNVILAGYLEKLQALQFELRRHNEELAQQQKDQREMLEKLRSRLAQETANRIQRAWNSDPQLKALVTRRAVVERQFNVASSAKLPESKKLGDEMTDLDKQIEALRSLIAAKDEYDPLTKQFLAFIDDSVKLVEQSRQRNEKRLKELFDAFVAAKPDMDKLPADQKARAKSLDEAYKALSSARARYQAMLDETNARADSAVRGLTQQVASQQAKVEARKRELAEARAAAIGDEPPPSLTMAEPERLAAIELKRKALTDARLSEAKLQNEWAQTSLSASQARAEADLAEAARLTIEKLDAERIALSEERHVENQKIADATGDPLATVSIAEVVPESASIVPGDDQRAWYSFIASAAGMFLVLMALAASRSPGVYIPPVSHYAYDHFDEPQIAGVPAAVPAEPFSMQGRRNA